MRNFRTAKIVSLIILILIVAATGLFVFSRFYIRNSNSAKSDAPTPREVQYGLRFLARRNFDKQKLVEKIGNEKKYAMFDVRDEYTLIFQLTNEKEASDFFEEYSLGGTIEDFDFESHNMLLSVGREILDFEISYRWTVVDGLRVVGMVYSEEYTDNAVFIYLMDKVGFLSGESLEEYYWENNTAQSNLKEKVIPEAKVISTGENYKVTDVGNGISICELFDKTGKTVMRLDLAKFNTVDEYNDEMIRITWEDKTVFFNARTGGTSEEYDFPTHYLIYRIFYYVRSYHMGNGTEQIQLILRDAYDRYKYAKIIRDSELGFSQEYTSLDELVKSVEYVDLTHVKVTYLGSDNVVCEKTVEVYRLDQ